MCSINHDKKTIFFHVPKTGGTFIRENLEKYYNFNFYKIKRPDHEEITNRFLYIEKIKKHYHSGNKIFGILEYFKNSPQSRNMGNYEYMTTSDYINEKIDMTDEKWNSYYKFTFIRNPYERFISGYSYVMKRLNTNIEFEKYIDLKEYITDFEYMHTFMPQIKHISLNGKIMCNYIGKLENLESDFKEVLLKIGFNESEINHSNEKKNVTKHLSISHYIKNQEILDKLNIILKEDIEVFNFKKIDKIEDINNINNINI